MTRVHSGVHGPLEKAADALIFGSLKGVTSQQEKADILTPWKQQDRLSKEVYVGSGVADPQTRRGMFHRSANLAHPHLNSRDGATPALRDASAPLSYLTTPDNSHYYDGDDGEWA